jgi:argininosuccinate synthase
MPRYAELIYNGFWFSPEREMLQAAIDQSQRMSRAPCGSSSTRAM